MALPNITPPAILSDTPPLVLPDPPTPVSLEPWVESKYPEIARFMSEQNDFNQQILNVLRDNLT
jgi:hypothetical protein